LSPQCFDLGLHQWNLAVVLGAQQHSKDARDPQPGALGRATSVPLVQKDQIRGQFQCQRDGLGLTGVESGREQLRDMALSKRPRFDPTALESLLDLLQRCRVGELVECRLGEVLLATSIGEVLRQLGVAIVPGNASLSHHLAEVHSIHLREFCGFAERERSLCIERDGEFGPKSPRNLPLGNAEALEHRVRNVQGHPHAPTIPRFDGQKPLEV
jgi:hypothetical protein